MILIDQPSRAFASKAEWQAFRAEMVSALERSVDEDDKEEIRENISVADAVINKENTDKRIERYRLARMRAHALMRGGDWDESEHPRDEEGKFTDAGGGGEEGGGESSEAAAPAAEEIDPALTNVGGDQWNKETAARLAREYAGVRETVDKIVSSAVAAGGSSKLPTSEPSNWKVVPHPEMGHLFALQADNGQYALSSSAGTNTIAAFSSEALAESAKEDYAATQPLTDDEEEPSGPPEEWEALTGDQQDQAWEQYKEKTYQEFLDNEQTNYFETQAKDDAAYQAVEFYQNKDKNEWLGDALTDYIEARAEDEKAKIPYDVDTLIAALDLKYETGYEGNIKKGLTIEFNDDELKKPEGFDPDQLTLPGVEAKDPATYLTEEMREGIKEIVIDALDKESDSKMGDMEAPDYLAETVAEYQETVWGDMSDTEKFNWVKKNTDIVEGAEEIEKTNELALPEKFDPLEQGNSDRDYARTQAIARFVSVERAAQLLIERGIYKSEGGLAPPLTSARAAATRLDHTLWTGWKASSTNTHGKILQVAIAEELGGRLSTHRDIARDAVIKDANQEFAAQGGFEGIRAYVRAKWETTQYLLDKAGIRVVDVYRAVNLGNAIKDQAKVNVLDHWTKLPDIQVVRNGAASTTTDRKVANDWDGTYGRVVLRAEVPRTAVVSVPAYGINVHSEHEVVVAGTAWVGWDAWDGYAPTFEDVPVRPTT